ncbi:LOW QUALITY PROTEIN: 39S ribosomal protein L42, mitochondrial [Dromiciops gliroides]|uniref:LOW QUALITY PROTEIN: 39S ribosomal protein L42, mitochondrial n=1 Tax=Dromiciops gliroides TaxID=33562 RepID=UPI001CC72187|nr:LOW QUALITY PROTEIN: 39S ribosomal protein L42, mitochondrial [Dromiciops gliroides]
MGVPSGVTSRETGTGSFSGIAYTLYNMALAAVRSAGAVLAHAAASSRQITLQKGALGCVCHKSTYTPLPDDYNCKVELALSSDGRTIVCYHPSVDVPYEHTKPITRPDPVDNQEETYDQMLKAKLKADGNTSQQGPMMEELSRLFFTTKHAGTLLGSIINGAETLTLPKRDDFEALT